MAVPIPTLIWELDDISTTQCTESSGNAQHGTYVNSPILGATGVDGTAVSFDGGTQRVNLPVSSFMKNQEETYNFWVKPGTHSPVAIMSFLPAGGNEDARGFSVYWYTVGLIRAQYGVSSTGTWYNLDSDWGAVPQDEWTMVTITHSNVSDKIKMYINGVFHKEQTIVGGGGIEWTPKEGAINPPSDSFYLACGYQLTTTYFYNGTLDAVKYWDEELTPAEILELYESYITTDTSSPVDMFVGLSNVSYRFWNRYEVLASTLPTDQVAEINFETDLTTATIGPNWIKRGIDNIARNNVSGVDGYYATLEGDLSQASCLALDTTTANIPANASVSLWFYAPSGYSTDDNNLTAALFSNKLDTESSFRRIDYLPDSTLRMVTQDSVEGQISHTFPTTVTEGEWHHVAYVSDGVRQKIFLDGVKSEITLPNGIPSFDVYVSIFGSYNGEIGTTTGAFHGRIDNFKIFDRILTDNEVQALSNEFTP